MHKWTGSRINYSNIDFVRRFHPPTPHTVYNNVLACYDIDNKNITFFMANWKKHFGEEDSKEIRDDCVRTLAHESTHGAIMYILWKDRFTGDVDLEWPLYNGMDKEYSKAHKENKKKKHNHKRLFS